MSIGPLQHLSCRCPFPEHKCPLVMSTRDDTRLCSSKTEADLYGSQIFTSQSLAVLRARLGTKGLSRATIAYLCTGFPWWEVETGGSVILSTIFAATLALAAPSPVTDTDLGLGLAPASLVQDGWDNDRGKGKAKGKHKGKARGRARGHDKDRDWDRWDKRDRR